MTVPPLKNNCFAMPAGIEWTPVEDALAQIQKGLHPVVGQETVALGLAAKRILAEPVIAKRSNPPMANSAVDGYGFCLGDVPEGEIIELPLQSGVAAAGKPYDARVKAGHALRILTGAIVPSGVDTVIMEEDVVVNGDAISFHSGLRDGANVRAVSEDFESGQTIFEKGDLLQPQDLGFLAAAGVSELTVYKPLRVAVISTGTELVEVAHAARADQIYDANKPMLLNMIRAWGFEAVDGGHFIDDPDLIRAGLNAAAQNAEAIFVSGGASAGDEDYVSSLLKQEGTLHTWRVAIKPGRPIAMALWNGVPTFGFPGNPVAAFVCALIFGQPALQVLAGQTACETRRFKLPAGFSKSKKAGRREYLRARIDAQGRAEVFRSEGSGLISGLSWSDGLVELPDAAAEISVGDMVTYMPYASFGL
ncbi:MAG: molybdopterin-binding protein [Rhodobacterales bacterium]